MCEMQDASATRRVASMRAHLVCKRLRHIRRDAAVIERFTAGLIMAAGLIVAVAMIAKIAGVSA